MGVPVNLFTGFLGVGKTTAVIDLLGRKPAADRWAVLVNEYGEVGIDAAMIEGSGPEGVTVREVGGGCVCCATAPYLPVALHFLLVDATPDRLLIETTGLGHPSRLLDTLREKYRGRLDLRATVGLVDPADFAKPEMRANPVFVDQIQLADVVVMNKLDTATPELVEDFRAWAEGLYPPKLLIAGTTHGRLDPAWLDLGASDERLPVYPGAHHEHEASGGRQPPDVQTNQGADAPRSPAARGWVFPPDAVFDRDRLISLLVTAPGVLRLKGVFHTRHDWLAVNRVGPELHTAPTAYRRDSRLEVFAAAPDWDVFERQLLDCRAAG
jgi:G3E family GTPase